MLVLVASFMLPPAIHAAPPISFADLLQRPKPQADAKFSYGNDPHQFAELWLPKGSGPFPVVVMLHGGCWMESLPGVELMAYIADDLRRSGVAVWNVEYRRIGAVGGGYPGTFLDAAQGIAYLPRIADFHHLDLHRLVFLGHSAGGHLVLWASAQSRIPNASALYGLPSLSPRAVFSLAGINDLSAYRASGPDACGGPATIDQLVGAATRPNQNVYADTSPAAMLPLGVRQFIVVGAQDSIVPAEFGRNYAAKAIASGDTVKLIDIESAGHFDLIDPASAGWGMIKGQLLLILK